jgi:uncharacterized protein (DUF4213/DUF364 family)
MMTGLDLLQEAKRRFIAELESRDCGCKYLNAEVVVSSQLNAREVLGDPGRDDFPLLRGKEVLMQAVYGGSVGQAFTAASGSFRGSLKEVLELPLKNPFERAVFISTMNAVLRHLGLVEKTVHCKNDGPKECAFRMGSWINEQGTNRVGLVGMQPALLEALTRTLGPDRVIVSDLADAGKERCGIKVLDGTDSPEMFKHCQLILMTGSTLVNGTIDGLMENILCSRRRVVFYGTTIAGAAYLLGLERWCPCST